MTKAQKAKARELLAQDCKKHGKYFCEGETCAIGCLALAAGASEKELIEAGGDYIHGESCWAIAKRITDFFGLTVEEQRYIQEANDSVNDRIPNDIVIRREKVLAQLDVTPTED